MSNGKGSRPRNNHSEAFRANYEAINWRKKVISAFPRPASDQKPRIVDLSNVYCYPDNEELLEAAFETLIHQDATILPTNPSKRAKSQGNGPSGASGGQGKGSK